MQEFNQELLNFLNRGTCSFTAALEIEKLLQENGYQKLEEESVWELTQNKYYVVRNDASIIAFQFPKKIKQKFNIVCTHHDTPSFMIKPNPDFYENNYLKLNVFPYGGILNYGFMDRPLGIAGRIILKKKTQLEKRIVDTLDAVAIIPSIAIHQNDKANSNLDLNTEVDLIPVISLKKDYSLNTLLKEKLNLKEEILEHELYLYNTEPAKIINDEFIISPRIDNLTCTFAALKAFLNVQIKDISVLAIFNSEEIGSNTIDGADSNFLIDTLKRICAKKELDLEITLSHSFIISADNTHAKHPNHDHLSDHTNTPPLNSGVLVMQEMNGTTNSITASIFNYLCEEHNIPHTYYTSRNDFATGSTQAGASLKHLSIYSLDIGLAMLAMHSSMEMIGICDTYSLYQALNVFYQEKHPIIK